MATPSEAHEIVREVLARIYADRDVLACQSYLVDSLLSLGMQGSLQGSDIDDFHFDTIENLYPDPEGWTLQECKDYCEDYGIEYDEDAEIDDIQYVIRDNAEPAAIYEWWLVTDWLCGQLRAIGEPVLEAGDSHYWGRTCTGQGYLMDGTLQRIADQFIEVTA